jgi:teichuronic acid biosynthesis glycosyltransferase TuaC
MRVLIVTKIFPNSVEPLSSPFNRQQFAALARLCDVELLATIPWFPGASLLGRWSAAGRLRSVPSQEQIDGLRVRHPRFAFLPKLGHGFSGPLYAASLAPTILPYRGRVDVVLGAWAYPDGFASVVIADMLGVPAVIKLHGSDIDVLGTWPAPRRRLRWALGRATRVIAVSRALGDKAIALGASPERLDIVPNGIDRQTFHVGDRAHARARLGLPIDRPLVLYVGHLSEDKGVLDLLAAFKLAEPRLGGAHLVLVGDGADTSKCQALARELALPATFVGAQPQSAIPTWLTACDLLSLPSRHEGMPNVVLEALACGRPVVASNVGGIPEAVGEGMGALVPPQDPAALAQALLQVLDEPHDAAAISAALDRPSWAGSAQLLQTSLLRALGGVAAREAA